MVTAPSSSKNSVTSQPSFSQALEPDIDSPSIVMPENISVAELGAGAPYSPSGFMTPLPNYTEPSSSKLSECMSDPLNIFDTNCVNVIAPSTIIIFL